MTIEQLTEKSGLAVSRVGDAYFTIDQLKVETRLFNREAQWSMAALPAASLGC